MTIRACKTQFPQRSSFTDKQLSVNRAVWEAIDHYCSLFRSPMYTAVWIAKGAPLYADWGFDARGRAFPSTIDRSDPLVDQAMVSLLDAEIKLHEHHPPNALCLCYFTVVDPNMDDRAFNELFQIFSQANPYDPTVEIACVHIKTFRSSRATFMEELRRSVCKTLNQKKRVVPGTLAVAVLEAGNPTLLSRDDYRIWGSFGHLVLYPWFKDAVNISLEHSLEFGSYEIWLGRICLGNVNPDRNLSEMLGEWIMWLIEDEITWPEPWVCYYHAAKA